MMYDDTFEESKIITISMANGVKKKIGEKFNENIEDFIEKVFPQDKTLEISLFKYMMGKDEKLALKIKDSNYMLLLERSIDRYTNRKDNYLFCFDIQERMDIIKDNKNEFIDKKCELKIPVEFNRKYYNNSDKELLDDIEKRFKSIKPYKTPSLEENKEFKKWYAYLTLLEKIIDAKDFYFEADILYTDKKAKVDISNIKDIKLLEKIKKARNAQFLFYKLGEVDISKPLHQWDEKDNKDRNFGDLKQNSNGILNFELDDKFIKKFKEKKSYDTDEIISSSFDTNDFIVKSRQYLEKSILEINQEVVYKDNDKKKINITNSIKNMEISKDEESDILDIFDKLSAKNHNEDADEINKDYINEVLEILKNLLPNKKDSKNFNPPKKLLLRVSYFRDQFQLKTLKRGLDQIQKHPLKPYLFGDKKIAKIDKEEIDNLEIEFLSQMLNDKQKEAIKKAILTKDIFMIQGPPGTGKTEVISELAYQEAIRGKKVLIVSQANMAVDNAIQRLKHPSLYPVRITRKDYEPEDGDSLPIEVNIGSFYQRRIVKTLSNQLDSEYDERESLNDFLTFNRYDDNFIKVIGQLDIAIPVNLDLSDENDRDDFKRILQNDINKEIIENRLKELQEKEHFNTIQNDFLEDMGENEEEYEDIEEEKNYLASNYMQNINIWGATLFETGKSRLNYKKFDVVIVDEVSKAMPPELVLPILRGEKLILVGDHKQLPPIISNELSLEDLAEETGISLDSLDFETTVFEKLIINNPDAYVMLNKQYRMHPHIQMAINQFYKDENGKGGLECGLLNPDLEKCHKLQDKTFKDKHLIWLKTKDSDREQREGTSFKNQSEIDGMKKTLDFLNKKYEKIGETPSVGVITFYGKQLGELTRLEKGGFWKLAQEKRKYSNLDLRFGTVDRFQGQEKDIIIVSLVRNNKQHNVGFAKKPNRVNVAFSRAKKLLIIVGNVDNFTFGRDEQSSKMYRNIFNIAKKFGSVEKI